MMVTLASAGAKLRVVVDTDELSLSRGVRDTRRGSRATEAQTRRIIVSGTQFRRIIGNECVQYRHPVIESDRRNYALFGAKSRFQANSEGILVAAADAGGRWYDSVRDNSWQARRFGNSPISRRRHLSLGSSWARTYRGASLGGNDVMDARGVALLMDGE